MKYALITGGTSGIGASVSIRLMEEDYFVIIVHKNQQKAEAFNCLFNTKYNGHYHLIKCDLSKFENIEYLLEKVKEITNKLNVLVLNAGTTIRTELKELTREEWNEVFNVNLTIPFFIVQKCYDLLEVKSSVIFTGSILAIHPHSLSIAYGVSKAAIHSLIKNLVKFMSQKKIRINGIAPGFIETDWQKNKPAYIQDSIKSKIALQRFGTTDEIADGFIFLINNQYINGEIINIDGGYSFQ